MLRASASSTTGTSHRVITFSRNFPVPFEVDIPGPTASAVFFPSSSLSTSSWASGWKVPSFESLSETDITSVVFSSTAEEYAFWNPQGYESASGAKRRLGGEDRGPAFSGRAGEH